MFLVSKIINLTAVDIKNNMDFLIKSFSIFMFVGLSISKEKVGCN
jgi:hypothetical protein